MIKANHTILIVISGLIWLAIGCFLLPLGINFITEVILKNYSSVDRPLLSALAPYLGGVESAALVWVALCLFIGYFKARYIFSKTVEKSVSRILSLPNPSPITQIYPLKYYLLLSSMVLLGVLVKWMSLDVRGGIDIVIGSALISGAMLYFRQAFRQTAV